MSKYRVWLFISQSNTEKRVSATGKRNHVFTKKESKKQKNIPVWQTWRFIFKEWVGYSAIFMLPKYIKVLKQRKKTPYQDKNWHKQLSFFLSFVRTKTVSALMSSYFWEMGKALNKNEIEFKCVCQSKYVSNKHPALNISICGSSETVTL